MARDPAFLFYPGDWMGGTMVMNRHQKGCYIDLLIAQFNNGPLSLETIKILLGTDQGLWGTVLSRKFKQDSDGNFFNVRLATEMEKRNKFCSNQADKVNKRWGKKDNGIYRGNTGVLPKIENENEIMDKGKGEGKTIKENHYQRDFETPTHSEVKSYFSLQNPGPDNYAKNLTDATDFFDHYESNGWMVGPVKMDNWHAAARKWIKNNKFKNVGTMDQGTGHQPTIKMG